MNQRAPNRHGIPDLLDEAADPGRVASPTPANSSLSSMTQRRNQVQQRLDLNIRSRVIGIR